VVSVSAVKPEYPAARTGWADWLFLAALVVCSLLMVATCIWLVITAVRQLTLR